MASDVESGWIETDVPARLDRLPWSGWHTLVVQVARGHMTYLVDGRRLARHGGRYYPESLMSIDVNVWFVPGGLASRGPVRRYREDVDWVLHAAGAVLSPAQVTQRVADYRASSVSFADTVPSPVPPLPTHCAPAALGARVTSGERPTDRPMRCGFTT